MSDIGVHARPVLAVRLLERGSGPYFYLPRLEGHLEARLSNDVFSYAEDALDVGPGTIKATVLLETVLAAFEIDEMVVIGAPRGPSWIS